MRELALFDTALLSGLVLLSLVLPVQAGLRKISDPALKAKTMRLVWLGQGIGAIAGVVLLLSAPLAPYAAAAALLACGVCSLRMARVTCNY